MNNSKLKIGDKNALIKKAAEMDSPQYTKLIPKKRQRSNMLRVVKSVARIQLLKPIKRKHR